MAEFKEVMRQYKRMCSAAKKQCGKCIIGRMTAEAGENCNNWVAEHTEYSEEFIMGWAAEHPEPPYPTWEQWSHKMFPNAHDLIGGCCFDSKTRFSCDAFMSCSACRKQRIPADIAEKLGIKPGEEWDE